MGPRPRGRGIEPDSREFDVPMTSLQWGHDRAVVEFGPSSPVPSRIGLQWGHDRAVVELPDSRVCSMESQTLQWGHDRAVVELASVIGAGRAIVPLQWGHDRSVVELW